MRCVFCTQEVAELTEDHIFPEAIGGRLVVKAACKGCNDRIGHSVEPILTENLLIKNIRLGLRLRSKSGDIPSPLRLGQLLGKEHVRASYSQPKEDGKGNVRVVPFVERFSKNGRTFTKIEGEAKEVDRIIETIRSRAARDGRSIIVSETVEERLTAPVVVKRSEENLLDIVRPLAKIVYGLTTHWLGDDYVDDSEAQAIRSVIDGGPVHISADLAYFPLASNFDAWSVPSYFHLAGLEPSASAIHVTVKIFGIVEGRILVTEKPHHYEPVLPRWLAIDPLAETVEGVGLQPASPLPGGDAAVVVEKQGGNTFVVRVFRRGVETTITHLSH